KREPRPTRAERRLSSVSYSEKLICPDSEPYFHRFVRKHFYARSGDIPLPRSDRLAALPLPNPICGERFLLFQKRYPDPDFVKGERSECISPLTTHK
ncbi:hypothetical protein, partial [Escherichia coli]|uniref:hypothetical protein n=1 Tax=Escherichia coli TaxID=562 RepID=UPI001FF31E1F